MLNRLAEVQALDLELDTLLQERGQVPTDLIQATEQRNELERALEVRTKEFNELRRNINANELELSTMEERRKEAAASAVRASTSKEASQFQAQELMFGSRAQELEEDTLPLMENSDRLSQVVEGLQSQLGELVPHLESLEQAEQERVAGVDKRMEEIKVNRDALAGAIDAGLLKQYDQVRKARRGTGLAEVVANATCGGCNVRLPIHVVQKVRSGTAVIRCPSCGRILMHKG